MTEQNPPRDQPLTTAPQISSHKYWHIRLHKNYTILALILLLLAVPIWSSISAFRDDYYKRASVSEMFKNIQNSKHLITEHLEKHPEIPIKLDGEQLIPQSLPENESQEKSQLDYRHISENGRITVYSKNLAVLLVMIPSVENDKIRWQCRGYSNPFDLVPSNCF